MRQLPYEIRSVKGGVKVYKVGTNKSYSSKPQTRRQATLQMRALYAAEAKTGK